MATLCLVGAILYGWRKNSFLRLIRNDVNIHEEIGSRYDITLGLMEVSGKVSGIVWWKMGLATPRWQWGPCTVDCDTSVYIPLYNRKLW